MAGDISELESFKEFLETQIGLGASDLSPEESVRLWRSEYSASVKAVRDALHDMEEGDAGRPLTEVANEIRQRHRWTAE